MLVYVWLGGSNLIDSELVFAVSACAARSLLLQMQSSARFGRHLTRGLLSAERTGLWQLGSEQGEQLSLYSGLRLVNSYQTTSDVPVDPRVYQRVPPPANYGIRRVHQPLK